MNPIARLKEITSYGTSNLIKVDNTALTYGYTTNLTAAVAAAGTALTVLNNAGAAANDYVLLGKLGEDTAEIRKISTVSGSTTINVDACSFAHGIDTPVTFIPYNQVRITSAATIDGTYYTLTTTDIIPNTLTTNYYDTAGAGTTAYKVAFYNSTSTELSDYSPGLLATSFGLTSLGSMISRVRSLINDTTQDLVTDEEIRIWLNEAQTNIGNRANDWAFVTASTTANLTASTNSYSLPSDAKIIKHISIVDGSDEIPLDYITETQYRDLRADVTTTAVPSYWTVFGGSILLYETPSATVTSGLIISYIKTPAELTDPTDTTGVPEPKILVDYAVAMCLKKKGDYTSSGIFDGAYERGIAQLLMAYAQRSGDAPTIRPISIVTDYLDKY